MITLLGSCDKDKFITCLKLFGLKHGNKKNLVCPFMGLVSFSNNSSLVFSCSSSLTILPPGDRMSRLASHLLTQGSFYPLYPPSEDLNVDYEQLELKATMDR